MPKNPAQTKIKVPKSYGPVERRAIASEIIDYIRERSKNGKGKGNRPWKGPASKYSDTYKKSKAFKAKGQSSVVDLTLSTEMLETIKLVSTRPGEITIGHKLGDSAYGKAKGNILGTYGQKRPIPGKARPYLELTRKEVKSVTDNFPLNDAEKRGSAVAALAAAGALLAVARDKKDEEN